MAEAIEILTLGVCGLGAVVVTGLALLHGPSKSKKSRSEQMSFDYDQNTEDKKAPKESDEKILAGRH